MERTKQDHNTPEEILDVVYSFDRIALDPCSNPWSQVQAAAVCSLHHGCDGLKRDWQDSGWIGTVFINPPYNDIMPWVRKTFEETECSLLEVLMLVPADATPKWARLAKQSADGICYLSKRVKFVGAGGGGAKQPSAIYYWGERMKRFARVFGTLGDVRQLQSYSVLPAAI